MPNGISQDNHSVGAGDGSSSSWITLHDNDESDNDLLSFTSEAYENSCSLCIHAIMHCSTLLKPWHDNKTTRERMKMDDSMLLRWENIPLQNEYVCISKCIWVYKQKQTIPWFPEKFRYLTIDSHSLLSINCLGRSQRSCKKCSIPTK